MTRQDDEVSVIVPFARGKGRGMRVVLAVGEQMKLVSN